MEQLAAPRPRKTSYGGKKGEDRTALGSHSAYAKKGLPGPKKTSSSKTFEAVANGTGREAVEFGGLVESESRREVHVGSVERAKKRSFQAKGRMIRR